MQMLGARPPYTLVLGQQAVEHPRDAEGEKMTRRRRGTAVKRLGFGMPDCRQRRHRGQEGRRGHARSQSSQTSITLLLLAA